jgi:YHS domain-containing protein
MRPKNVLFVIIAVSISLPAAVFRWDDSAHSIGLIKASGGEARHPVFLGGEWDRCNLISTATVIPPYRGDAKVVLEGKPELDYEIFSSGPVVDLGIRRLPKFRDNTLYGLEPMDRIALWVLMHPPGFDHVCGMSCGKDDIQSIYKGKRHCFCSESCRAAFEEDQARYLLKDRPSQTYSLAFYDVKTGKSVLNVPITFKGKGDQGHGGGHH